MYNSPDNPVFTSAGIGVSESRGRRPTMEDRHLIVPSFMKDPDKMLVLMFDGHGGKEAAKIAVQIMPDNIQRAFNEHRQQRRGEKPRWMIDAFIATDRDIKRRTMAGSTALVAYRDRSNLVVAGTGDSRALLVATNRFVRMNDEHKAINPSGFHRAIRAGGRVEGLYMKIPGAGGIALSRALGDREYGNALPPDPSVYSHKIVPEDVALVLACDGLNSISDEQVAEVVRLHRNNPQAASEVLVREAFLRDRRPDSDNLTAMVIPLT